MPNLRNTDFKKEAPGTHNEVSAGGFLSYTPSVFLYDYRKFKRRACGDPQALPR